MTPTVTDIRGRLEELGVTIPEGLKKAGLEDLLAKAEAESPPSDGAEPTPGEAEGGSSTGDAAAALPSDREREEAQVAVPELPPASLLPVPTSVLPSHAEWLAAREFAEAMAKAPEFVPKELRGRPDAVLASIMTGRELGIGPMQALRHVNVMDGRPSLSAELLLSLMRRGVGDARVVILESESTRERAFIRARRTDTAEVAAVEYTWEEASAVRIGRKGGGTQALTDKDNWRNYPADMLWARCVGRLARRLGSDLVGGIGYAAEELADWEEVADDPYGPPEPRRSSASHGTTGPVVAPPPGLTEWVGELTGMGIPDPAKLVARAVRHLNSEIPEGTTFRQMDENFQRELWDRMLDAWRFLWERGFSSGVVPAPSDEIVLAAFSAAFEGADVGPVSEPPEGVATSEQPAHAADDPLPTCYVCGEEKPEPMRALSTPDGETVLICRGCDPDAEPTPEEQASGIPFGEEASGV